MLASKPLATKSWTGTTLPAQHTDQKYVVTKSGVDLLEVKLDWPTPDDLDLYVFRKKADGSLVQVASSTGFVFEKERALVQNPRPATYILRVENFASASPQWTLTASQFDTTMETLPGLIENYTLSCEKKGRVLQQTPVIVDRGQQLKVDLSKCIRRW